MVVHVNQRRNYTLCSRDAKQTEVRLASCAAAHFAVIHVIARMLVDSLGANVRSRRNEVPWQRLLHREIPRLDVAALVLPIIGRERSSGWKFHLAGTDIGRRNLRNAGGKRTDRSESIRAGGIEVDTNRVAGYTVTGHIDLLRAERITHADDKRIGRPVSNADAGREYLLRHFDAAIGGRGTHAAN